MSDFETYRDWEIFATNNPTPGREYTFHHRDYQGSASDVDDDRFGQSATVKACKAAIDEWHNRGQWRRTPWLLRILGYPHLRRPIYADWRIGGGFDGWEYERSPQHDQ